MAEYFAGLRAKRGRVRGAEGSLVGLTEDIYRIAGEMFKEKPATLAMLPLGLLIPVITAAHWANEMWFCRRWAAHFRDEASAPRMLWDLKAGAERA